MRFYKIALFVFIMYTFGGLIAAHAADFGLQAGMYSDSLTTDTIQKTQEATHVGSIDTVASTDFIAAALGWFYQQVGNIANTIFSTNPLVKFIAWLPFYMNWIGIPPDISLGVWGVLMLIELIGFYEFFTGREIEK